MESPVTEAASVVLFPSYREVGTVRVIVMLMTEASVTVATATSLLDPSFAEVAVMVTVPPAGTVVGAV